VTGIPIELLLRAYRQGYFPMARTADDPEVDWVRPDVRGVIPLDGFHLPARLARTVRGTGLLIGIDQAFAEVMALCAEATPDRDETWINAGIRETYQRLHQLGVAHSVEAWDGARLVGGLYGLKIGGAFFGESMFSRATDASKVALVHLVGRLKRAGFALLDAQFVNPHLAQFGTRPVPHDDYMRQLDLAVAIKPDLAEFLAEMSGEEAVAYARQPTTQAS
jgi:leucyl/phenylalanyl-tRNA--protein transferase